MFLIGLFVSCGSKNENKQADRPNILFAIADDASWKYLGAYGCNWVKTPGFDRVAKEGLLFNNAYTSNAKCAPSRASILTGRNSWQLEEAANHSPVFPSKFKTYAEALGENGYYVGSVAKGWAPGNPGEIDGKKRELTGPKFDEFLTTPPTSGICNNDYSKNFEAFLESKPQNTPFCFWYGSLEPHRVFEYGSGLQKGGGKLSEINEVPTFWPDVDSIRTDMLDYAYELEYFDNHLERMLKKLEETGELENTIVIVTADNGMAFPRIKGDSYEYSNHLPLAIMWPKGIKNPGRVIDDFINFSDFAPTYLELAGLTVEQAGMQDMVGRSLTDIFYSEKEGTVNPERNYQLVGKERHDVGRPNDEGYPIRGIVKNGFIYLKNFKTDRWPKGNPETGYLNTDGSPTKTYILNTRRNKGEIKYWQLNFGKRESEELYNIDLDPYCVNNLADKNEYTSLKEALKSEMLLKLTAQEDPRIVRDGDVFDHYKYSGAVQDFYNRYMAGEAVPTGWVNKSDFEEEFNISD